MNKDKVVVVSERQRFRNLKFGDAVIEAFKSAIKWTMLVGFVSFIIIMVVK